ncbi:MAG: ATP-binding protein [Draconibacterium sp.]|nr:ATP-binding protein [Draconibacterium sp.]
MKTTPKIIVITGAESTGKSTLTETLAKHFNVPFITEIARDYVERLNKKYDYNDVEEIAKIQVEQLNHLKNTNHPFIFVDTWLVITKIWFEVVFKKTPDWFDLEIQKNKIDLFLVCDTDLPWIADSVRENGGEQREILQNKYIETIREYTYKYKIVRGEGEKRIKNALGYLNNLK